MSRLLLQVFVGMAQASTIFVFIQKASLNSFKICKCEEDFACTVFLIDLQIARNTGSCSCSSLTSSDEVFSALDGYDFTFENSPNMNFCCAQSLNVDNFVYTALENKNISKIFSEYCYTETDDKSQGIRGIEQISLKFMTGKSKLWQNYVNDARSLATPPVNVSMTVFRKDLELSAFTFGSSRETFVYSKDEL